MQVVNTVLAKIRGDMQDEEKKVRKTNGGFTRSEWLQTIQRQRKEN